MKFLIALFLVVVLCHSTAIADEVFGDWMIFPGPNPDPTDLLPDANPDEVFRIGQILFEYPPDRLAKDDDPISELSQLQSVADAVRASTPDAALEALVTQQLVVPHKFHFESATVLNRGDLMWNVSYELFPKEGGFSGVPFRYLAVLDGHGNVVPPRLSIFDAYFHSPEEGWACSVLQLPESPTPEDSALTAEEIRSRAIKSLRDLTKEDDVGKEAVRRMKYHSQSMIQIPVAADTNGQLHHIGIWAVNFRTPNREGRADEVFTVWVTADGRTAELQHLAYGWGSEELQDDPESE